MACNFTKDRTSVQVFSSEYYDITQKNILKHFQATAATLRYKRDEQNLWKHCTKNVQFHISFLPIRPHSLMENFIFVQWNLTMIRQEYCDWLFLFCVDNSSIRQIINVRNWKKIHKKKCYGLIILAKSFHTERYFEVVILRFQTRLIYLNSSLFLFCGNPVVLETNLKVMNRSQPMWGVLCTSDNDIL